MEKYIQVYHDVISQEKCQYFIDKFEAYPEMQEVQNNSSIYDIVMQELQNTKGATLTQINLMKSADTPFREDLDFLGETFMKYVEKYKEDCDIKSFQFPKKFGVEPFKIKRYLPDTTDEFPEHVDVLDYATARRFLVMFIYLNNNVGGSTELPLKSQYDNHKFVSHCTQGSILIFPPLWPWIHAGRKPLNEPKYIIGSYLHYV